MNIIIQFLVFSLIVINSNCLYFHLYKNTNMCVYEEFYSELVKNLLILDYYYKIQYFR